MRLLAVATTQHADCTIQNKHSCNGQAKSRCTACVLHLEQQCRRPSPKPQVANGPGSSLNVWERHDIGNTYRAHTPCPCQGMAGASLKPLLMIRPTAITGANTPSSGTCTNTTMHASLRRVSFQASPECQWIQTRCISTDIPTFTPCCFGTLLGATIATHLQGDSAQECPGALQLCPLWHYDQCAATRSSSTTPCVHVTQVPEPTLHTQNPFPLFAYPPGQCSMHAGHPQTPAHLPVGAASPTPRATYRTL